MPRTVEDAIKSVYAQSKGGPPFPHNECKMRTRLAYAVPSDGSKDAAEAWSRTKHRIPDGDPIRGALRWYLGGAEGHGHVTIEDGHGNEWSVDIKRSAATGSHSYWDIVPIGTITTKWTALRYVGRSLDIDGVQVVPTPLPRESETETHPERIVRFKNELNEKRVIDLNVLDLVIKAGTPRRYSAAAYVCKWACIKAARAFLKVVG
jgi:hypothetical protein